VLYRIEVKDVPPQEVALIRGRRRVADAIAELLDYAGELGTGPPFAARTPELEVGLPVAPGVAGNGRIEVLADAGFRALAALYEGPYERLAGVSRGLWNALRLEGADLAGEPREVYLSSDGLIELLWPLAVPAGWLPSPALFTEPLAH
jgi:effector-binding domain-containing protein